MEMRENSDDMMSPEVEVVETVRFQMIVHVYCTALSCLRCPVTVKLELDWPRPAQYADVMKLKNVLSDAGRSVGSDISDHPLLRLTSARIPYRFCPVHRSI